MDQLRGDLSRVQPALSHSGQGFIQRLKLHHASIPFYSVQSKVYRQRDPSALAQCPVPVPVPFESDSFSTWKIPTWLARVHTWLIDAPTISGYDLSDKAIVASDLPTHGSFFPSLRPLPC